jgi:hypothetical protein
MNGCTNHVRHQGTPHDLGVVLGELVTWVWGDCRILGIHVSWTVQFSAWHTPQS